MKNLSLAALFMALACAPAAAKGRKPPELRFEMDPPVVTAGKTLVVRFQAPPALEVPRVTLGGRSAFFFQTSSDTWRAFWGVDSQEPPGVKTLEFKALWRRKVLASTATFTVRSGDYPISRIPLTKKQDNLFTSGQLTRDNRTLAAAYNAPPTPDKLWDGLFVWPTTGIVSSPFGRRRAYGNRPPGSGHSGTDIANVEGTPIAAPAPGRVVFAGWLESFGNAVVLDHGQGVFTYYLHMKERRATLGEMLKRGDAVGLMGKEGLATGSHLHWSMSVAGERVDALEWTERAFD